MSLVNPLEALLSGLSPEYPRIELYLEHWARVSPFEVAAVDGDIRINYRDLADVVDRIACGFGAAGIGPGDCVAVLAPPSIDFLASFLATLKAGATWLGINPKYTRREIEHLLADAAPKLLLARRHILGRDYSGDIAEAERTLAPASFKTWWLEPAGGSAISPDMLRGADADAAPPRRRKRPSDIAAYVYTSGSTGAPKAACLSHLALIRGALVRFRAWPVTPLRLINNLPINHVGGLGDVACTAIVAGGSQVFLEKFSAAGTLQALYEHGVTYWYQAPTMFEMCMAAPEARDMDWSHLQAAIWSGGRPSDALLGLLAEAAPLLGMDYSMTESVGPITLAPLWASHLGHDGSVGWPDPYRVLGIGEGSGADPDGGGEGRTGEVMIRDDWMFSGYRNMAGAGEAFTADGWFRTGDLAALGHGGRWRLVGRSKEMFKSGGYNVYPREVEMAIEAHPAVASAVVVDVPDPLFGEVGVAFVVAAGAGVTVDGLRAHCRDRLANYKVPKHFEFLESLPMLAIGKVDKQALRKRSVVS